MIKLAILYGHPVDEQAFDQYYQETHVPLAKQLPGLQGFVLNKTHALNPEERAPTYFIAELYFESLSALQVALQSPEGQRAAGDVQNFATGGATMLVGEVQVCTPLTLS